MKSYPAIHSDKIGSEVLDPIAPGAESTWNKTLESVMLMQSSNERPAITAIDFLAIESQARAARSAWMAREVKTLAIALVKRIGRVAGGLSGAFRISLAKPIKH